MYTLKPYAADFVVRPVPVIYNLQSYHKEDETEVKSQKVVSIENKTTMSDEKGKLQQQNLEKYKEVLDHQKSIIVQLLDLEKRLDDLFVSKRTCSKNSVKTSMNVAEQPDVGKYSFSTKFC